MKELTIFTSPWTPKKFQQLSEKVLHSKEPRKNREKVPHFSFRACNRPLLVAEQGEFRTAKAMKKKWKATDLERKEKKIENEAEDWKWKEEGEWKDCTWASGSRRVEKLIFISLSSLTFPRYLISISERKNVSSMSVCLGILEIRKMWNLKQNIYNPPDLAAGPFNLST